MIAASGAPKNAKLRKTAARPFLSSCGELMLTPYAKPHAEYFSVVPESGREGRDIGSTRLGYGQQRVFWSVKS